MDARISRRELLVAGVALAAGGLACSRGVAPARSAMTRPLTDLSAVEAVAAMQRGELACEAYAAALLARCEQGKDLNAFITLEPERVLEAARALDQARAAGVEPGPLHGLPIPIKDSVNTRQVPTTGGTPALRRFQPAQDAEIVTRLARAGALALGKTNLHELSFGWTSNNHAFGAVRNPYDPTRIPGGSSGGTAAAVAARMSPLGVAEDTQGSIRVPAAMCGICGFRPTQDRYPNHGVVPITPLFDQVGPHARNVADLELFDRAVTGARVADSRASLYGVRLGVARGYFFEQLDSDIERISEAALDALRGAGVELVEAEVPGLARLIGLTTAQIQLHDAMPMLTRYLEEFGTGVTFDELIAQASPDIRLTFERYVLPGGELTVAEQDFIAARDVHLPALRRTLRDYFAAHRLDAMIFPAAQITAPPIGDDTETLLNGRIVPFEPVISRNISPGSTGGLPCLVIPAGLDTVGLPVCIEIDGPAGSDTRLLAIGRLIEDVLGALPPPRI